MANKIVPTLVVVVSALVWAWMLLILYGCGEFEELPNIDIEELPDEITGSDELDPPDPIMEDVVKSNPICTKVMRANDGNEGFLWRDGDHTGHLVVLLPKRFTAPFVSVTALRKDGTRDRLRYTGFANGDRQHWRGDAPSRTYKSNSLVIAKEPGNKCEWQIARAGRRND